MAMSRVEVVVLGLLAEGPLHGYQLLERYRDRAMEYWAEVGRASVYQALHRLEREGLVAGRDQGRGEGPERRVYRITRAGRDRLRHALQERLSADASRPKAELAVGFGHLLRPQDFRRGIAARAAALEDLYQRVGAELARMKGEPGAGAQLARRLLDLQSSQIRTERAWLATLRREAGRLRR
jgi:DNA-binding PadR family transcriptional regulator